jgi:hypothetical protein
MEAERTQMRTYVTVTVNRKFNEQPSYSAEGSGVDTEAVFKVLEEVDKWFTATYKPEYRAGGRG